MLCQFCGHGEIWHERQDENNSRKHASENRELFDHIYELLAEKQKLKLVIDEYKTKLLDLAKKLFIVEISVSLFDDIEESTIFLETYMKKMGYLHTNSFRYKILHNKILHNKIFLMAQLYATWKKHGIQFLFTVIKRKIK